jgi:CheY-like chemotaxis protein
MNATHEQMKNRSYDIRPGNYVYLTVRDTGTGMDRETLERIFEPFFTTKGLASGTGLGLASVYGIIKKHGGYIHVESEKGRGSTFHIYLPAASEEAPTEKIRADQGIVRGSESILMVDDEEMVLDSGTRMLEALGYSVLTARSGREAIKIYKDNEDEIDMVILDMIMPELGGGEVFDKLKEIDPDIKVLLLTGYSLEGQAKEIMERGCHGFMQKPFTMVDLSQKIRRIISNNQRLKEDSF